MTTDLSHLSTALLAVTFGMLVGCQSLEVADPSATANYTISTAHPQIEDDDFDEFEDLDEFGDDPVEEDISDPIEGYNRFMFQCNDKFYFWAWKPLAKGYRWLIPQPARVAVDRAFKNVRTAPRFANCLLQLRFRKAGSELRRFTVNSTLGLGGLFDPADSRFGWIAPGSEDFGQTLAHYGVGDGFPLVLPFFGPSNLRDTFGIGPDLLLDPTTAALDPAVSAAVSTEENLNKTSLHIGEYESLKSDALDPYTFMRNAYQQNRAKKIKE